MVRSGAQYDSPGDGYRTCFYVVPGAFHSTSLFPYPNTILILFFGHQSYTVDTYRMYSASAFAANTMVRSLVGAAFPLFTRQMYEGMGVNWASTLIGGIALMLLPIPFLFYKYGPRIRARSKFSPSKVRFLYHSRSVRAADLT